MSDISSETIALGGRNYQVAPLKFRDLKRIVPLFLELGIDSEAKLDAQGEIVTAAIQTADPGFTRAAFDDLAVSVPELQAAISAIAVLSGLERRRIEPGDGSLGEAGAASRSVGATSTP